MSQAVFCLSKTEDQAQRIVVDLKSAGFNSNDISVLFPDKTGTRDFAHEHHTKAPEGTATGAVGGGLLGGALGWLAGIGTLAIPGVGPFIAAGPIMAALGGAAVGATVGGVTGALVGLGIPEPMCSLGSLISYAFKSFTTHPYQIVPPVIVLALLMLCFNMLADGLRDAFDPKMKER